MLTGNSIYDNASEADTNTMSTKGMKSDSRLPFREQFFRDNFQNPLNENDAGIWQLPLEMVRR